MFKAKMVFPEPLQPANMEIVEQISNNIVSNDSQATYSATIENYYPLKTKISTQLEQQKT